MQFFIVTTDYLGCYSDLDDQKTDTVKIYKTGTFTSRMTNQWCAIFCYNNGYNNFGLQNG